MIHTRPLCVHCGVGMVHSANRWCNICVEASRANHGVCRFCARDLTAYSACWQVRRVMDQALVAHEFPFWCPSCYEHNDERNYMEVIQLHYHERGRHVLLVCPVCHTDLTQTYRIYRPGPKNK